MKYLTFSFLLFPILLSAQDYLITFSGSGESDKVSTVIVENLTQNKSLTLNGNDILHLKSTVTEISDIGYTQTEGIQFYPNPMKEFSVMEFTVPEEGTVKVELFDISGRKLTQMQNYLNPGRHSYRITGVGKGVYVLKVTTGKFSISGKLFSDNKTTGMVNIAYQNTIPFNSIQANTKSVESEIIMQYNPGDALKFTATGGDHKSVLVDVITQNKIVDFHFYKCTDMDNRNYATVKIGTKIWMAENLAFLPEVHPPDSGSMTEARYYVYDYFGTDIYEAQKDSNYMTYGVLYNYPAAMISCPNGWHLPTWYEYVDLFEIYGEKSQFGCDRDFEFIGGQLKETGNKHWNYSWQDKFMLTTNKTGFTALPGGKNDSRGYFYGLQENAFFWSSTEWTQGKYTLYHYLHLYRFTAKISCNTENKNSGFCVRCIKD